MGARVVSPWIQPAIGYGSSTGEQRIDSETGLPVWLVQVSDPASARHPEASASVTVELLTTVQPVLPGQREVEFVGLTMEPLCMGTTDAPWTSFVYRALGIVAAVRTAADTQPIPMDMLLELRSAGVEGRTAR